jgi:hypothetical protein
MTSAYLLTSLRRPQTSPISGTSRMCVTYGKTVEEAIEMAGDAITGYVESLIEDGEAVPVEDDPSRSYSGDPGQS